MMKKLSCLLLAILLILQIGVTVIADEHFDRVDVKGKLQIAKSGIVITNTTGNGTSFTKNDADDFPKFDYLYTLNMKSVRDKFTKYYNDWAEIIGYVNPDEEKAAELTEKLNAMKITGEFTIEVKYDSSLKVPEEYFKNGEMIGFDDNVKIVFGNDVRKLTIGDEENTLTITVSLLGKETDGTRPGYVLTKELMENIERYLCNFTLKCEGVETTEYGTFEVRGKLTGFTLASGRSASVKIDYKTVPEYATASCTVKKKAAVIPGAGEIPGGGSHDAPTYTISFDVDGDNTVVAPVKRAKDAIIKREDLRIPHKDGYSFKGWYFDEALTDKVNGDIRFTQNMILYGSWQKANSAVKLDDTDHFAYVIGYPDGTVKPTNSITREEIATIFFRLLLETERNAIFTKENGFTDVSADRWSNTAVSTMEKGGFINGYEDGSFGPQKNITRAEFATIASRLDTMTENATHSFSDISGHWAEKYIADAVAKGWIAGYEDGTFRPQQYITRAEAMTIINRMLNRFVNEEGLHKDAILWPDNSNTAWYFYAVEEATNSHDYIRQTDGVYEIWTTMRANRNWAELEK